LRPGITVSARILDGKRIARELLGRIGLVIDVSINRLDEGRLVDDVEFDAAAERASWIAAVPGAWVRWPWPREWKPRWTRARRARSADPLLSSGERLASITLGRV
jgi:hypothetical protein